MQERQTKQKQIIYDVLTMLDHPTATEVYNYVHEHYPTVSRATVFRVLGGFVAGGKALELKVARDEVRYDYNVVPHYHAHCTKCGKVADVEVEQAQLQGIRATGLHGFEVRGYSVEFFGTCASCKEISQKMEKSVDIC